MRRTYCAELFEDASLVGLYPECASPILCNIARGCLLHSNRLFAGTRPPVGWI